MQIEREVQVPDNWVILKVNMNGKIVYRVLASWSGGYLDSDFCTINSGITAVERYGDYYDFTGISGSLYRCHRNNEKVSMAMQPYNMLVADDRVEHVSVEDIRLEEK